MLDIRSEIWGQFIKCPVFNDTQSILTSNTQINYSHSVSVAMRQLNPIHKKRAVKLFLKKFLISIFLLFNFFCSVSYYFETSKRQFGIRLFKVDNGNTQKMCERRHWRGSGVFIVNVEQILYINLMFPLFTLNR